MPAKEAIVRRLNFCQWTAAASPWLSAAVWDPHAASTTPPTTCAAGAYAALDLSSTTDLTGLVLLVEPQDDGEPWRMLPWCWLPEDGMREALRPRPRGLRQLGSFRLHPPPQAAPSPSATCCSAWCRYSTASDRLPGLTAGAWPT